MQLKEALNLIWQNKKYEATSVAEAVSHLNEEVAESLNALSKNDFETARNELEDALSCLFIAFKFMEIDPEEAVKRQIKRMKKVSKRTMHVFSDHIEIRVDNEIKGKWNIWSSEDLTEAKKMAKEFKCEIIWEQGTQLSLADIFENE